MKKKSVKKPKYAFTRFSVNGFAKLLSNLTVRQREIIESYGFGSLLLFDKCYVPNNFSKWVARAVNHKSGDIVIDGKIISLTKNLFSGYLVCLLVEDHFQKISRMRDIFYWTSSIRISFPMLISSPRSFWAKMKFCQMKTHLFVSSLLRWIHFCAAILH